MARVIPSGGDQDHVWRILLEGAKSNDALARLFQQMAARREEKALDREFREYMYDKSVQDTLDMRDLPGQTNPTDTGVPNPLNPPAPQAGTTAAPGVEPPIPQAGGNAIPGSQPTGPSDTGFTPQTGPQPPVRDVPVKPMAMRGGDAFAQAGDQEFSAQARQRQPSRAPAKDIARPQPSQRQYRGQQEYEYQTIAPHVLKAWADAERANGITPGTLLVLLGVENGGGKKFGPNADGGTATGFFQWIRELRQERGVSDADTRDPIKMGVLTAQNMRRNAENYKNITGKDIGNGAGDIYKWTTLHKWGYMNGPLILHALESNPDAPMTAIMYRDKRKSDAENYKRNRDALVSNKLHPEGTVAQVTGLEKQRMLPWETAATKLLGGGAQPLQTEVERAPQQPQQTQGGGGIDPSAFLQSRAPKSNVSGLNPIFADRAAALIAEAEAAVGAPLEIREPMALSRSHQDQVDIFRRSRGGRTFLAARPGGSRHQHHEANKAHAIDIPRGAHWDWIYQNRNYVKNKYGMEFLKGRAFLRDKVHMQMTTAGDPNARLFKGSTIQVAGQQPQQQQAAAKPPTSARPSVSDPTAASRFNAPMHDPLVEINPLTGEAQQLGTQWGDRQRAPGVANAQQQMQRQAALEDTSEDRQLARGVHDAQQEMQRAHVPLPLPRPNDFGIQVPAMVGINPPTRSQPLSDAEYTEFAQPKQGITLPAEAMLPPTRTQPLPDEQYQPPGITLPPTQMAVPPSRQLSDAEYRQFDSRVAQSTPNVTGSPYADARTKPSLADVLNDYFKDTAIGKALQPDPIVASPDPNEVTAALDTPTNMQPYGLTPEDYTLPQTDAVPPPTTLAPGPSDVPTGTPEDMQVPNMPAMPDYSEHVEPFIGMPNPRSTVGPPAAPDIRFPEWARKILESKTQAASPAANIVDKLPWPRQIQTVKPIVTPEGKVTTPWLTGPYKPHVPPPQQTGRSTTATPAPRPDRPPLVIGQPSPRTAKGVMPDGTTHYFGKGDVIPEGFVETPQE